jgi:hypothetical protein
LKELKQIQQAVVQHADKQLPLTEPDSRLMKINNVNRQVSYNVQTDVDAKYHLIVAHEVTNTPDHGQLTAVTKLAQGSVGKAEITVLSFSAASVGPKSLLFSRISVSTHSLRDSVNECLRA